MERLEKSLDVNCTSTEELGGPNDYGCLRNSQFVMILYDEENEFVGAVGMLQRGLDAQFLSEVADVYGFSTSNVTSVVADKEVVKKNGLEMLLNEDGLVKIQRTKEQHWPCLNRYAAEPSGYRVVRLA